MKKRSLSLFLAMVTAFSLLLATSTTVFADTADGETTAGTGAFGLQQETKLTSGSNEYYGLLSTAPFGSITDDNKDKPITLNAMSELFLSYGWDVHIDGERSNWMRVIDASPGGGTDTGDLSAMNRVDNKYTTQVKNDADLAAYFAESAGVNPGSGKDEYVAYLRYVWSDGVHLSIIDKDLNEKNPDKTWR